MTYNLFLDDERNPIDVTWGHPVNQALYRHENWVIVRNMAETIAVVDALGWPKVMSFDHDLGKDEPTGHDIMKYLCNRMIDEKYNPANTKLRVHSMNPIGAENIIRYFSNFVTAYNR